MNNAQVVAAIDEEIERLQKVRSLLTGHTMPLKRGQAPEPRAKRTVSPEARERMAAAQRQRWAESKK